MPKQLFRSRDQRMIAGVCGGLSEYFDTDPVVIRLIFVVATIFGGAGFGIYLILWLIIPEEDAGESIAEAFVRQSREEDGDGKVDGSAKKSSASTDDGSSGATSEPSYRHSYRTGRRAARSGRPNTTAGAIILLLGVFFLINNLTDIRIWNYVFPLLLIVIGLAFLGGGRR